MKKVDFKLPIKTWYSVILKNACTDLEISSLETLLNIKITCPGIENCKNCGDCGNCIRHPSLEDRYARK